MRQLFYISTLLCLLFILLIIPASTRSVSYFSTSIRRGGGRSGKSTRRSGGNSRNTTNSCFPASAIVTTRKGDIEISRLRVGDIVLTKQGWSRVFMFSHAEAHAYSNHFLHINAPPRILTLTSEHYVLTNHGEIIASQIQIGDYVYDLRGNPLQVTSLQKNIHAQGLYNPHTIEGTIIIDGIIASTYTNAVSLRSAKALLAPLRAIFSVFQQDFSCGILERESVIRSMLTLIGTKLLFIH